MEIQVLHTADCGHLDGAVEAVRDAIHMAGLDAEPALTEVSTQKQADEMRFLGSPTVQIDGVDVEPPARHRSDYNLG